MAFAGVDAQREHRCGSCSTATVVADETVVAVLNGFRVRVPLLCSVVVGREPGPDDLLFPDMPHPEHLEAIMVEDMKAAGLDPAFIYAFEKTGLLVTQQNQHLIPDEDLAMWDAAIEEFEMKKRKR
jgi:hypothetical protein